MPKYKRIKQDKDAEVLLNRIEMRDLQRDFEIADGYISRFLAIFKPFVHMNRRHPRYLHIQLQMSKQFRETFEWEFGKTIDCQREINIEPDIDLDLWQLLLDFSDVLYASCRAGHVHFSLIGTFANSIFRLYRSSAHDCLYCGSKMPTETVWEFTGRH